MLHTLQLVPVTRPGLVNRQERQWLDYFISGESLLERLHLKHLDKISPFGWGADKEYEWAMLHALTLAQSSKLQTGRTVLYVCPECGDLDCGAITAEVLDLKDSIVWKNFGYETGYDGIMEKYTTLETVTIDRASYFKAFLRLSYNLVRQSG